MEAVVPRPVGSSIYFQREERHQLSCDSIENTGAQLVEFRGRRSLWFFFAYASALGGAATLDGERLGGQLPVRGAQPHQMLLRRPAAGSRGPASDARRPGSAERRHEYVPTDSQER